MKLLPKFIIAIAIALIMLIAGGSVYVSYLADIDKFSVEEQRQISIMIRSTDDIEQLRRVANANLETIQSQGIYIEGQQGIIRGGEN
jgi:hypothetical protein